MFYDRLSARSLLAKPGRRWWLMMLFGLKEKPEGTRYIKYYIDIIGWCQYMQWRPSIKKHVENWKKWHNYHFPYI